MTTQGKKKKVIEDEADFDLTEHLDKFQEKMVTRMNANTDTLITQIQQSDD